MPNETANLFIEQLRSVLQTFNYDLISYDIGLTDITAIAKVPIKDLDQSQQNILQIQFNRIINTQGWSAAAATPKDDYLFFTLTRPL